MKSVLGALLGVPATVLVAGGLGLVGATVVGRLLRSDGGERIRWSQIAIGVIMLVVGAGLVDLAVVLFGTA